MEPRDESPLQRGLVQLHWLPYGASVNYDSGLWYIDFFGDREPFYLPNLRHHGRARKIHHYYKYRRYTNNGELTVGSGDTVLDIGAFLGVFSREVEKRGASVLAVEPDPVSISCLKRNLSDDADVLQKAVWSSTGKRRMVTPGTRNRNSLIGFQGQSSQEMETITVSNILDRMNWEKIDLLKVEGEGAEPEILQGTPLSRVHNVSVSTSAERQGERTVDSVLKILRNHNFDVRLHPDHEFVYASRNRV